MTDRAARNGIYTVSEDVVTREIEGDLIIIPLRGGVGDLEDELYSLNGTGRAIWEKLDGQKTVSQIAEELFEEYEVPRETLEADLIGLIDELLRRRMIEETASQ